MKLFLADTLNIKRTLNQGSRGCPLDTGLTTGIVPDVNLCVLSLAYFTSEGLNSGGVGIGQCKSHFPVEHVEPIPHLISVRNCYYAILGFFHCQESCLCATLLAS